MYLGEVGTGIVQEFGLLPPLAALKENGYVNHVLSPLGIILVLTKEGEAYLTSNEAGIPAQKKSLVAKKGKEYARNFQQE